MPDPIVSASWLSTVVVDGSLQGLVSHIRWPPHPLEGHLATLQARKTEWESAPQGHMSTTGRRVDD